jgi:hypothetical protein
MSISRTQLKNDLGLVKVADITEVRKALGQKDWKNSQVCESDAIEIREFYRLVRNEGIEPKSALLQIATDRNGRAQFCDEIDTSVLDASDAGRDCSEEKDGMLASAQQVAQSGAVAMVELADAVSDSMMDGFMVGLTSHTSAKMNKLAASIRGNLKPLGDAIRSTPLDLRSAALPTIEEAPKLQQSKQQRQLSPGLW